MLFYKDSDFPEGHVRLTDDEYARALQAFPIACADTVLINTSRRMIYLADRIVQPVKGRWWIGGRVYRGETFEEAAVRKLFEETGLRIARERLTYVETVRHLSEVRQQPPQDAGSDTFAFVFSSEASDEELRAASAGLDPREYRPGSLEGFTMAHLMKHADIRPQVIDIANLIFP